VIDEWIAEVRQKTISQIIYCPLSRDVIQMYQMFGAYFPWEPGGLGHRITPQKYWLLKGNFPWEPGEKHKNIDHKYRLLRALFLWDPAEHQHYDYTIGS
jgi:hypothetical protein